MPEIIDITIDVSDISAQLSQARREQTGFKEDLQSMPNMHETFGEGIERTLTTVDLLEKKLDNYSNSAGAAREQIAKDILSGVEDVNVSTRMFSQSGSFAVSLAKQMFGGLSAAAQSELNKSTAEIARMITSALGTLKSKSVAGMAREILTSADAQKLFDTKIRSGTVSSVEYEKYIAALLPHVVPMHLLSEYQTARHGSFNRNNVTPSLATQIPNSYLASYKARTYQGAHLSEAQSSELLRADQREALKAEIMRNDAAARAARKVSGMTRRNSQNELMLSRNITRSQFEQFRHNLWDDYVVRASGRASDRVDIFDESLPEDGQRKAYARMSGSSAGKVLRAMQVADTIVSGESWGADRDRRNYERLNHEAARSLEQYEIARYSFEGIQNGKAPSKVMISESPNTRAQGQSSSHNKFTDKVVELSFRGYDSKNQDHHPLLEMLISGQPVNLPGTNKRYIAQNMHGTGEDQIYRMVEEAAYNEVMQREIDWLKSEGLISDESGKGLLGVNYWNNFIASSLDFGSQKNYRRHMDATGKGWTPGSSIEADQQNKNFGIIDMSRMERDKLAKLADGLAWVTSGILPRGSIQGRFALGGKGTLHQVNQKTQGQWAINAGLIKQGERFVLPGPNGDVDLTDMHGMFDISTVKNMQAYSNFNTPEELNTAFTKLLRHYNISSMTTYDDSETRAKGLGSQAAMFMNIPQTMQDAQVAEYRKRMRLLDEEAGIREYILNGADNVLGERLRSGEITVANPLIQHMVAKEKEALQRRALAGEFIDFSDKGMAVNQKVNKNPLTSIIELSEISREGRITKLRELMKSKGLSREYTDDEIAGIWGLGGVKDGAVVDFSRPDEELIALQRSPNGFGQFVYGKNYAKLAKDVFKKFGVSAQGVYLSEQDMLTLGDADFDGDGVKTLYGDLAIAVKDTAIAHAKLKASVPYVQQASETPINSENGETAFVDSAEQRRLALDDAVAAAMAMGLTSGAGEKAAQFDLSDPAHRSMLQAAIQADRAYSLATASAKNATRVNLTPQMLATNALGRKWQFLPSKFSRLFNVTGQDDVEIPDAANVFTASNGLKINMEELEKLRIDRINLPSINQDSMQMGLRSAMTVGPTGDNVNQMNAVLEALDQNVGYGDLGPNAQNLLKNMRAIKLQTNAGLRGMLTEKESTLLQQQVVAARQEIFKKADELSVGKSGMIRLADGTEMSRASYVNAAARAANIDIALNHQEQFGITKGRQQHKFGDEAAAYVTGLSPMSTLVQPAGTASVTPIRISQSEPLVASRREPSQPPATSSNQATSPAADARQLVPEAEDLPRATAQDHPMQKYLSDLRADIEENGMPQDVAAANFAKWHTETIPAAEDPFIMSEQDAKHIVKQFLTTKKLPAGMRQPETGSSLSSDSNSILMRDLEQQRAIEGSRGLYEDLIGSMRETSSKWYGISAKQNEDPEYVFYSRSLHEIKNAELRYQNAMKHGDPSVLGPGTAAGMDLANQQSWMQSNYFSATRAHFASSGDNVFESLRKSVVGTGDEFDKQLTKLNHWTEAVSKLENQLKAFEQTRKERSAETKIDNEEDEKAIAEQKQRIENAKALAKQGKDNLLTTNNDAFRSQYDSLYEAMTGKLASPEDKIKRTVTGYKDRIAKGLLDIEEAHAKRLLSDSDYTLRLADFHSLETYANSTLEKELLERYRSEERRRMAASTKRVENLRTQGRRLDRSVWGRRGNGVLARSLYEQESGKDQYDNRIAALKAEIDREKDVIKKNSPDSDAYKIAEKNLAAQKSQLADTESAAKSFSGSMGAVAVAMNNVGKSVDRVISQFGRQMFQKAMQEAKRFVQEYDAAMTEIQMITGKTDAEIATLGSGLIQTAIDMKVSVSDVTSAASDLYRQGLEDEDVDVRMEDVLKFAKVAKIKSEEASKIITTAQSNGLVESSGEAMDALVALGDSAATTASEIAKGMQKSAASAKQAGVSYKELVTMLTIITSKTQLGGNQAGTALQTLMYRLYRVNEGEDFYDENGNRIAANDASKALSQLGVSIYDDNGVPRGAYDIMVDVAKNWNDASNISQEMVLNKLGAGRQRSNIATLIQGLAEDDGALADKYMKLASESEGITDTKYLAYLDSLNAALISVKSSFDQLIAAFNIGAPATAILDFLSEFLQGLAAAEKATGSLSGIITALGVALLALAAISNPIPTLVVGAQYGYSQYGNRLAKTQPLTAEEIAANSTEAVTRRNNVSKYIDESETILRKAAGGAVELSELEVQTVQDTLDMLATQFGVATTKFTGAADEVATASSLISQANKIMETEFAAKVKQAQQDAVTWAQDNVLSGYTSLPTAKQQMDYMMQTNYSGVRTGADKIWEIDARAASSDRGRYEDIKERYVDDLSAELTNNQYLNGEKSLDSYNWTKAGYSDTSKYERALAFSAWMQSISPGFTDMVSNLGLNKENILDKFGDIPLNYENQMTIATTPYRKLSTQDHVKNNSIWRATFGGDEDGKTSQKKYEEAQYALHSLLFNVFRLQQGDFSGVLKLNKEDLLADVDTLFAQIVDPYVDATSSRGMKEYFIDQLIQQGYLSEEITDAEAYRIFTQQQELLFKAMWADESTVSTDKWMQSYIKNSNYQDYLPYHRILRPDGALYKDGLTLAGVNQELAKLNDELMPEPEKIHKDIAAPLWNIVSTADGQIVAEDLTEQNARDVYQDKYASVIISQPDGSSLQFASRDAAYEYQSQVRKVRNSSISRRSWYQLGDNSDVQWASFEYGVQAWKDLMLTDDVMSNYLTAGVQVLSPEFWEGLSGKMPDDIIGMNLAELAFSSDSEYQEFVDRYNQWLNRGRGLDPDWIGEVEVTAEQAINWALAENDLTISAKELYKNWLDVSDYGASAYKYLLGTADNQPSQKYKTSYNVPDEKGSSFAYASYSEAAKAVQDKISASYKISPAYNLMEQSVPEYSGLINDEVKTDQKVSGYTYEFVPPQSGSESTNDKIINYMEEPLKEGLATYDETDEVKQKRRVDAFARMIAYEGIANTDNPMQAFSDLLSSTKYGNLTSLFQSIGDGALANLVNRAIVKEDDGETRKVVDGRFVVDENVAGASWADAWAMILENTGSYSDVAASNRLSQHYYVSKLMNQFNSGLQLSESQYDSLSEIYGSSMVGKMQQASLGWYDTTYNKDEVVDGVFVTNEDGTLKTTSQSMRDWFAEASAAGGDTSWKAYKEYAQAYNAAQIGKMFSNAEQTYFDAITNNLLYGIDGLTPLQALSGAKTITSNVASGTINNYLRNADDMVKAYSSQFSSMNDYIAMAQMLEGKVLLRDEEGKIALDSSGEQTSDTYTLDMLESLEEGSAGYKAIDDALKPLGRSAYEAKKIVEALNAELSSVENAYGDMTAEVLENSKALSGNKREIASAHKNFHQLLTTVSNNQYYRQQYRSGDRSSETLASIASQTGFDEDYIKSHTEQVDKMLDMLMESDREEIQAQVSAFDQYLTQDIVDAIAVDMPEIKGVGGSVDFSEAIGRLSSDSAVELQALANLLSQMGFTASIVATEEGESVKYKIAVSELTGMAGRRASGGGGGGKSAIDKLLEGQEREVKMREHKIKMIQYEETRYANANELSNQAIMIQHEINEEHKQIELRNQHIDKLKQQMSATKKYSDKWYQLRDAIMSAEEAVSELNNTISENEKKIEELEQQVLKLHTDLESAVRDEIDARIQAERDMLDGTVSMQNIILDAIRERYRKEWELMQEDISKKRKALEEEMSLIDERLQRRKDAEDEAAKHEELTELKRQLALVSMDSTRTKDQAKLREKIREIEDELAWDAAEDEADIQKDALQEQIDAYDSYEEEYQKYLDELLEDANNFSSEVSSVLSMSQEDLLKWLSDNIEEFRLSLKDNQEQLTKNWTETFKQMKGIVDTFWEEIAGTLSSKESFLDYMKQSTTYQHASDDEKAQLEYNWSEMYDNWISAKKESDEAKKYEHDDDNFAGNKNTTTNSTVTYYGGYNSQGVWVTGYGATKADAQALVRSKGLTSVQYDTRRRPPEPPRVDIPSDMDSVMNPTLSDNKNTNNSRENYSAGSSASLPAKSQSSVVTPVILDDLLTDQHIVKRYARGGIVDYTGYAWVDGTKQNPEAFQSSEDTKLLRAVLDSWQYASVVPSITSVNDFDKRSEITFGDIHIAISEASFAEDADYDEVARRVGDVFTKELSKQGIRTSSFNF